MTPPQGQAQDSSQSERLDVVIAGAGVAGLEAAFALRELAGDRVALTWLAPTDEFVYRPMTVGEPFTSRWARHYPLSGLAAGVGAAVVHDALSAVEVQRRVAITSSGSELSYDALLVGPGASLHRRFQHVTTVDDTQMDVAPRCGPGHRGWLCERLAFVVPAPMPWPLPVYELALMIAGRAMTCRPIWRSRS